MNEATEYLKATTNVCGGNIIFVICNFAHYFPFPCHMHYSKSHLFYEYSQMKQSVFSFWQNLCISPQMIITIINDDDISYAILWKYTFCTQYSLLT